MKKSVIILIGVIYIAAIALVSFFGLQAKIYNEKVYVERIEILNEYDIDDQGNKYIVFYPDENGERKFQINYRVYPDDASTKKVDFNYDTQNTNVTIDENGVVTFKKKGSVIVNITATDGSGVSEKIEITSRGN